MLCPFQSGLFVMGCLLVLWWCWLQLSFSNCKSSRKRPAAPTQCAESWSCTITAAQRAVDCLLKVWWSLTQNAEPRTGESIVIAVVMTALLRWVWQCHLHWWVPFFNKLCWWDEQFSRYASHWQTEISGKCRQYKLNLQCWIFNGRVVLSQ